MTAKAKILLQTRVMMAFGLALFPQQLRHDAGVVNVEIAVRVFDGDRFVDDLTLGDFEITEDGRPQKPEAVYLIKKATLERREGTRGLAPPTARTFLLAFELHEYLPRVREALEAFLKNVLRPGDGLIVGTPRKTYRMRPEVLTATSREKILEKLVGIIRRDILTASLEYRRAVNDLRELVAQGGSSAAGSMSDELGSGSLEEALSEYRVRLRRLESLRSLDEGKLLEMSRALKGTPGQKIMFLFYQREFIPVMDKDTYISLFGTNEVLSGLMADLFSLHRRDPAVDPGVLRKALADSSITIHFLFLTSRTGDLPTRQMEEHSEDIFKPFLEMSRVTGGMAASSSNPAAMMATASAASENYYLLYYSPPGYRPDGKFREVTVRVKGGRFRVFHRSGYFAN